MEAAVVKKQRRTQERAEVTRQKLIDAALVEFSNRGFDGVTSRDVEVAADVQRGLLKYHFGDKDGMWRAAADQVFGLRMDEIVQQGKLAQDLPPRDQLALRIRSFVRFSAEHPELNRLMVQECKYSSWRTDYLIDSFITNSMKNLKELADFNLSLDRETFIHWYYFFIGAGAFAFSVSPEVERLFKVDVSEKAFVDRHAELLVDFLMSHFEEIGAGD
ncbi:MAG: TetR family transcriptional regulator [Pseudomonadota bacterium]